MAKVTDTHIPQLKVPQPGLQELSLPQWLEKITRQHPSEIEFGLERIRTVAGALGADFYAWLKQPQQQVVLIGGTNGKGTTTALVENLCLQQQKRVFSYTSPHLLSLNERFLMNGEQISDIQLIKVFRRIESVRGDTPLTFFEFITLAAFVVAFSGHFDVLLFEIGLGGRLDAVNLIEADIAVITSIAIDHTDWLGHDLIAIAREKLGIARRGKKLILADNMLSAEMLTMAQSSGANCLILGKDFTLEQKDGQIVMKICIENSAVIEYQVKENIRIHPHNLVAAVVVATTLGLPLKKSDLDNMVRNLTLPARFETLSLLPHIIVDVSHNEQAISTLASRIKLLEGPVYLVCGMFRDKAIKKSLSALWGYGYQWFLSDLAGERGASARQLQQTLPDRESSHCFNNVDSALKTALAEYRAPGTIIVFGSFLTAAAAIRYCQQVGHFGGGRFRG